MVCIRLWGFVSKDDSSYFRTFYLKLTSLIMMWHCIHRSNTVAKLWNNVSIKNPQHTKRIDALATDMCPSLYTTSTIKVKVVGISMTETLTQRERTLLITTAVFDWSRLLSLIVDHGCCICWSRLLPLLITAAAEDCWLRLLCLFDDYSCCSRRGGTPRYFTYTKHRFHQRCKTATGDKGTIVVAHKMENCNFSFLL